MCYERACYERMCHERMCHERMCHERVCHERVCHLVLHLSLPQEPFLRRHAAGLWFEQGNAIALVNRGYLLYDGRGRETTEGSCCWPVV